jgi:amphi-Trp domain-containing protein
MAKDRFEFGRIASGEEIAEYLTSLAEGLKRGEVTLESGERQLVLAPGHDVKLGLKVKQKEEKGKISIEIGWKRGSAPKLSDLHVQTGHAPSSGRRGR